MKNETGTRIIAGDDLPLDAPLTDRINAEPSILRGLSSTECWLAVAVSFLFWVPVSLIIGLLVHHLQVSVIFMGAGPIFTVWALSGWLQTVKRNHPDYYYQHLFKQWLTRKGLMKSRFITHSGLWDIGRSFPMLSNKRRQKRLQTHADVEASASRIGTLECKGAFR